MEKFNVTIDLDEKNHKIVVINKIIFFGKKKICWENVEEYLKGYIGEVITIDETGEEIGIAKDFPDEFKGSEDTQKVKGANAKAKANCTQGLRELIKISRKISENGNQKEKNKRKAARGWHRYLSRFALPVMRDINCIKNYNVYLATLIVRVDGMGKLYLYDVINVKKEYEIIKK